MVGNLFDFSSHCLYELESDFNPSKSLKVLDFLGWILGFKIWDLFFGGGLKAKKEIIPKVSFNSLKSFVGKSIVLKKVFKVTVQSRFMDETPLRYMCLSPLYC